VLNDHELLSGKERQLAVGRQSVPRFTEKRRHRAELYNTPRYFSISHGVS
jgi:hypothetical protein